MLDQIIQQKKEEIKSIVLPETCQIERRSFKKALLNPNRFIGLIAEVKKASPSKGLIKEHFVPETIAADYEAAKADALSVLTDTRFFQGRNQFLTDVKQTVSLPVLRKDFIIDSLQVEESFRIGADAILLIGEALEPSELHELYLEAREKGMDVLVEIHDETVLERILQVFQPDILGINNRDLKTFRTSVSQTEKIAQLVPDGLLVSESGIGSLADLQFVNKHGAQAVLVGESLMREDSQQKAIRGLFGE
ncbi:indole-3-glycerol phosphate synthase TrpC [Bacillus velezensis]|nr:indole-3-glycerol phosphate synthase TrpC [Bacillus velezensis]